mmetsp:Transcript_33240/g.80412  ORF Transcript_33240/g.80412 Transcript_33240/m.80412 type:complete len:93 (-) Transcript_33240:590-868(-)
MEACHKGHNAWEEGRHIDENDHLASGIRTNEKVYDYCVGHLEHHSDGDIRNGGHEDTSNMALDVLVDDTSANGYEDEDELYRHYHSWTAASC